MKLGRYKEGSKSVAMCDWPVLFGFMKMDSAEIQRSEKESLVTGVR